ncbi:hypothetical protein [Streptomyces sp. NPDC055085]
MPVDVNFVSSPPVRPQRGRRAPHHVEIAEALKARPGEWAEFPKSAPVKVGPFLAQQIRTGVSRAYGPKGSFDAYYAEGKVWLRYVGQPNRKKN